jgi:hypothetical protein
MQEPYKLYPCVVVTTKVEAPTNAPWWKKNFYLDEHCEKVFAFNSRVQLYLIDESLYRESITFTKVKAKIATAIMSEHDLKNAPIIVVVDSDFEKLYKENFGNDFIESEFGDIFTDLEAIKLKVPDNTLFNNFCSFQPDPVFPINIGEIITSEPFFSTN